MADKKPPKGNLVPGTKNTYDVPEPTKGKTKAQMKVESAAGMFGGMTKDAADKVQGNSRKEQLDRAEQDAVGKKCGGAIKKMASGGVTRADGCAQRGKTKGRML